MRKDAATHGIHPPIYKSDGVRGGTGGGAPGRGLYAGEHKDDRLKEI